MRPAPQGRAYQERRHYCHITIHVTSEEQPKTEKELRAEAAKAKRASEGGKAKPKAAKAKPAAKKAEKAKAEEVEATVETTPVESPAVEATPVETVETPTPVAEVSEGDAAVENAPESSEEAAKE